MHIHTSNLHELKLGFGGYTCNWGVHFCGLYETEQERDDIILGFLAQGTKAGDLQLYCPAERTADEFRRDFTHCCPECEKYLDDPDIVQLFATRDLYYPDGVFSPWAMDSGLEAFYEQSQKNGPRNVRASAEMVWALEAVPGVEHLMAYEARLNYFIENKPWISVCLYNVTKFSGKIILQVLQTHPYIISKGIVTENPFFVDPDVWLAQNAPEFMNRD
jgi:hypothetical protein